MSSFSNICLINIVISRQGEFNDSTNYVKFEFIQNINLIDEKRDVVQVIRGKKKEFKNLIENINIFYNNIVFISIKK
ncbi:MAG: hypothetical protein EOP34_08930 [Rickettsiales bacterium]|nr:MAG: hypothetical protein EOP34_08930 [Rickettsiales bacterium]